MTTGTRQFVADPSTVSRELPGPPADEPRPSGTSRGTDVSRPAGRSQEPAPSREDERQRRKAEKRERKEKKRAEASRDASRVKRRTRGVGIRLPRFPSMTGEVACGMTVCRGRMVAILLRSTAATEGNEARGETAQEGGAPERGRDERQLLGFVGWVARSVA